MKKLVGVILVGIITIAGFAFAEIDELQRGKSGTRSINVAIGQANTDITAVTPQIDTNVTTTVTLYTPDAIGQFLVGGNGTGTNALWVAYGTETNTWVKVNENP